METKTKKIVTTAILLAIAVLLSLIEIFKLPFGGSITLLSMMPVVLISYIYGVRWGVFSALVYSVLQMLTGMHTISAFFLPGDSQMAFGAALGVCLFDYVLAFTALGVAGMFKNKFKSTYAEICLGTVVALMLRYLMHIISGTIFFGAWADWFFGDPTGLMQVGFLKNFCSWVLATFKGNTLALFYSILYNGSFMIPEIILTAFITPVVYRILKKNNAV